MEVDSSGKVKGMTSRFKFIRSVIRARFVRNSHSWRSLALPLLVVSDVPRLRVTGMSNWW
jgi:hypothetical protein